MTPVGWRDSRAIATTTRKLNMSTNALLHLKRAQILKRTLGTRRAAGFLRNRGVSLEEAPAILAPRGVVIDERGAAA